MTYKGGKLEGVAHNTDGNVTLATTIQAFMVSSVLSKNKDVVGLFPCKDINGEYLHNLILQILNMLKSVGFKVLTIISDNNGVNRSMFTKLCGGTLKTSFCNMYETDEKYQKVFVMFDPVHLFKSIRNNWINQSDSNQTLIFPSFYKHEETKFASVSILKSVHRKEENNVIKLAPSLTKKVLFPTNIERQNVNLCVKFFDEKNIAALKYYESSNEISSAQDTIELLDIILKWWKVMNVKYFFKGVRLNDLYSCPIKSLQDEQYLFMDKFLKWLQAWDNLPVQGECQGNKRKRNGKLTTDTQTALTLTVRTILELSVHLLEHFKFKYILLGKFQTDNLEARFGQYRQMSGGCYNISVVQVLEAEKKLKSVSLIKLVSSINDGFEIRDLHIPEVEDECNNDSFGELEKDIDEFSDISNDLKDISLSDNDLVGLVYIGGYICFKNLKSNKCNKCEELFVEKKDSLVSFNSQISYLSVIDRGSLKYPSSLVVNILVVCLKVFQVIIGERYEMSFLKCKEQRKVLFNVMKECISSDLFSHCENCGINSSVYINKCIFTFCNILLKNYGNLTKEKLVEKEKGKSKKRKFDKLQS